MTMPFLDEGRGDCVVFLHGNPDCKESWSSAIDLLAKDYRCIAPDLPGFGASTRVPTYRELFPDAQARALERLLDEAGVRDPVLLVVHDLGALMGMSFALHRPERVRGILAINTTFHAGYRGHPWGYLWAIPFLGPLFAAAMRFGLKRAMAKESPDLERRHVDRMVANLSVKTCRTIGRVYFFMYNPLVRLVRSVVGMQLDPRIPIRVLWGERDPYIPIEYARLGDEPLRVVAAGSHFLPLERPDLVVEEVRALAARGPGPDRSPSES